jgi:hypothetical protein
VLVLRIKGKRFINVGFGFLGSSSLCITLVLIVILSSVYSKKIGKLVTERQMKLLGTPVYLLLYNNELLSFSSSSIP